MSSPANDPDAPKGRDPLLGKSIGGRYRVMDLVGKGGMGAVYEAVHTSTEKRVAIKVLNEQLASDTMVVARFRREAMASSKLTHENCVQVLDFGEDPLASFYIAMEFVDGHGLDVDVTNDGPMSVQRVARIGVQLASALDSAHAAGIVHRDLKPANIMVTQLAGRPDFIKVVDFGIAKFVQNSPDDQKALTVPGTIFGTPEYMSPEQARGDPLDGRSDVYSASVVLWHMLLGRSPFKGDTIRDTLMNVFQTPPPSPADELGVPSGPFEEVLSKGLAKNANDRFADARAFLEALEPFVTDEGQAWVKKAKLPTKGIADDGSAPETLPAERGLHSSDIPSEPSDAGAVGVASTTEGAPVNPPSVDSQEAPTQDSFTAASPTMVAPKVDIQPPPKVVRADDTVAAAPAPQHHDGRRWLYFSAAASLFLLVVLGGALGLRTVLQQDPAPEPPPAEPAPVAEPDAFPLLTPAPAGHQVDEKALKKALRKAEQAIDNDDHTAAKAAYGFAIQLDPSSPEAHRGYGLAAYQLGELELAKAHLEHLFDLDDDTIAAQAAGFLAIIEKKLELQKKRAKKMP